MDRNGRINKYIEEEEERKIEELNAKWEGEHKVSVEA